MTTIRITENSRRRTRTPPLGERDRVLRIAGDLAGAQWSSHSLICSRIWMSSRPLSSSHTCRRSMSTSAAVWPVSSLVGHVLVDPVRSVARLVERDDADCDEQCDNDSGEDRVDDEDDGARGTFRRVRSRTSGLSVNAMTLAVRKRKRTCPSRGEQEREDEKNGRTTSWIHLGIWIVGPSRPCADRTAEVYADGDLATVRNMATPRSRHAARLRADRRRAQARARRFAVVAADRRARRRDARVDCLRRRGSAPAVSRLPPCP